MNYVHALQPTAVLVTVVCAISICKHIVELLVVYSKETTASTPPLKHAPAISLVKLPRIPHKISMSVRIVGRIASLVYFFQSLCLAAFTSAFVTEKNFIKFPFRNS